MDTREMSIVEAVNRGQVKVLSLWQAWASVLVSDLPQGRLKTIETRSWQTPYRGWLLIHAAKMMNVDVGHSINRARDIFHQMYGDIAREHAAGNYVGSVFVPLGCIVGAVRLDNILTTEELIDVGLFNKPLSDTELSWGDYSPDRHGWITSHAIAFRRPVPCRGRQSLFDLDGEIRARVLIELDAARAREAEALGRVA